MNMMIRPLPSRGEEEPENQKQAFRAYLWEMRMLATWTIWLPFLTIAGILLFTWVTYSLEMDSYTKLIISGGPSNHQIYKPVLDYVTPLRTVLEILLPLLGLVQIHDILLREWRRDTIAILVARRPLQWYFAVRLGGVIGYLFCLVATSLLLSWWITPQNTLQHIGATNLGNWFWQAWLTAIAPTIFIMALGLCVCHLVANTLAGIILPATCLLANWLFALQVQQSNQTNLLISYLFFGWSEQELSTQPEAWFYGKLLLCAIALFLLGCQVVLLKKMTIQQKSAE
jgi:hypothetical protein